jgi:hypothetical protein
MQISEKKSLCQTQLNKNLIIDLNLIVDKSIYKDFFTKIFGKRCLYSKKKIILSKEEYQVFFYSDLIIMKKYISLTLILLICSVGFLIAGTTPGQESSLKRNFRKSTGTISAVEVVASPEASTSIRINASSDSKMVNPNSTLDGNNLKSLAHKSTVTKSKGKLFNGKGLGTFSLRNIWQAGKALKSYKQSGFLQISITIFIFVVILLLIAMLLGVILNDLFIIFYIATALLLVWLLLFMLGNLGIKKR